MKQMPLGALCCLLLSVMPAVLALDAAVAPVNDATVAAFYAQSKTRMGTQLDLVLSEVTGSGLAQLTDVTDLRLSQSPLTDEGMVNIGRMAGLIALSLDGTLITDAGARELAKLSKLERLSLRHTRITDAGLASIAGLTNLKELDLGLTEMTDAGIKHVLGLTRLEQLDLRRTFVTGKGFAQLKDLAELKRLYISMRSVDELKLLDVFAHSEKFALDLQFTLAEFQANQKNIHNTMSFRASPAPDEEKKRHEEIEGAVRSALSANAAAAVVDLSPHNVQHGEFMSAPPSLSAKDLDAIAKEEKIRGLILSEMELHDRLLPHLKPMTGLRILKIASSYNDTDFGTRQFGSGITDMGLESLAGMTQLEELDLWGTRVVGYGLAQLEGMTKLKSLNLGYTFVNGTRLRHLKGCTELTTLNLQFTRTLSADLALLRPFTKLEHLNLAATPVTDAGLAHLKGLTSLKTLDLTGTKVSLSAVQDLKRALPALEVTPKDTAPSDSQPPSRPRSDMW